MFIEPKHGRKVMRCGIGARVRLLTCPLGRNGGTVGCDLMHPTHFLRDIMLLS
jgi:hypothetical protein